MTEEQKILYGFGETKNIVAIQQVSSKEMRLYIRNGAQINFLDRRFYPFFFANDENLLPSFENKYWKKRLTGNEYYKYIFAFETWLDMNKALRLIAKNLNKPVSARPKFEEVYVIYDPVTQFLIQTGETLFKGMNYEELNIIYVKSLSIIEKQSEFHSKYFDQVFAISLADNHGWKTTIFQKPKTIKEKDLLIQFLKIFQEKNPDIIIGYNLFDELAYLFTRFQIYDIPFAIGRDNTEPLVDTENKIKAGENKVPNVLISGRHVIDLLPLISHSRTILREIDNYSLPVIAKYFGIEYSSKNIISDSKIPFFADNSPKELIDKVEAEINIIIQLSNHLIPQYFYQAQFIPMNFIQVINSGVANKIELLLVREYLRKRHSIPKAEPRKPLTGGYTDVFYRGLFENIIYADVESLYPSIIIQNKIYPRKDILKIFLKLITILTKERLRLKRKKEETENFELKLHYETMQTAYKNLINSFYGYLGFPDGIFNDFEKANEVTKIGQQILKHLINEFQKRDFIVIEVDTDGLYVSTQKSLNELEERKIVEEISQTLPEHINLSFGGRFKRMLSYKKKNYALLGYDNKLIIKGSALISKSFENYALEFLSKCIEFILTDKLNLIPKLYRELISNIIDHKIDIKDLAKTEILKDSAQDYIEAVKSGRRQKSAAYELALKYYGERFQPGLKISYYIKGNDPDVRIFENCELIEFYNPKIPDYNVPYYIRKLDEYISRFEVFFKKEDFLLLFPREGNINFEINPKVINTIVKE